MLFYYRVHTDDGEAKSGALEAPTRLAALKALVEQGWRVDYCATRPEPQTQTNVQTERPRRMFLQMYLLRTPPGRMANFYSQLASLLGAGVTPHEAAAVLADRAPSGPLRIAMREIAPKLAAGASLSEELARYPQLFPPQDVGLLRAAERSGDWESICRELEDFYTRIHRGMAWILVSRVYCACLLIAVVLVPFFPWAIVRGWDWYLNLLLTRLLPTLLGIAGLWVAFRVVSGLQIARPLRDRLVLLIPVLGGYEMRSAGLRFFTALEALLKAGLEVGEAMDVAADAAGNTQVTVRIRRVAEELRRGANVEQTVARLPFLTREQRSALATAFQAGRLTEGLHRLTEDARVSAGQRLWAVRIASIGLTATIMTIIATIAFLIGWLNLYAAMAEKAGVGDLWRELWSK